MILNRRLMLFFACWKNIYRDSDKTPVQFVLFLITRTSQFASHTISISRKRWTRRLVSRKKRKMGNSFHLLHPDEIHPWPKLSYFQQQRWFQKLRDLFVLGMDLQSNSVSGSPLFDQFEQERVMKFIRPPTLCHGLGQNLQSGSIYEKCVSRFLIDHFVPVNNSMCFCSTHLYTPFTYPQSLLATGYRFSSSVSANALTWFAFQMNYNREYDTEVEALIPNHWRRRKFHPTLEFRMQHLPSDWQRKLHGMADGCFIGQVHPNSMGLQAKRYLADKKVPGTEQPWFRFAVAARKWG